MCTSSQKMDVTPNFKTDINELETNKKKHTMLGKTCFVRY